VIARIGLPASELARGWRYPRGNQEQQAAWKFLPFTAVRQFRYFLGVTCASMSALSGLKHHGIGPNLHGRGGLRNLELHVHAANFVVTHLYAGLDKGGERLGRNRDRVDPDGCY